MNDNEYHKTCDQCGRPMAYCKGQCCGKPQGCQCKEYCGKVCGAIRPGEPKCPYQAVIPSLTVESVSNLKDLADCFVHVSNINTTFYIDDKHRIMTTWAGPVEYNNYDLDANELGLRSQFLIDFANEQGAYYNKTGDYQIFKFGEGGGDSTLSFTMQYTADGPDSSILPGWTSNGLMEKVKIPNYDPTHPIYKSVRYYTSDAEYPVTFLNDETSEVLTPEELYNLLVSGEDVIINHVPLGFTLYGEWASADSYVDGVRLTKYVDSGPYNVVGFGGSVFSENYSTYGDGTEWVQAQLGFTISGSTDGESTTYEQMTIQGFETGSE